MIAELLPVQMELASDEVLDRPGERTRPGQQTARVAEDAQLQREHPRPPADALACISARIWSVP